MNQSVTPASSDPLLAGLLARITSHRLAADGQLITRAYQAAAHWHQGQQRRSGDPYLTHPVAVAAILAELGADDQTLCAALLHDMVAGTRYTLAAMRQEFGAEVTGLVAATMALDQPRRQRARFAVQIVLGAGRMAATLYLRRLAELSRARRGGR